VCGAPYKEKQRTRRKEAKEEAPQLLRGASTPQQMRATTSPSEYNFSRKEP
jgi:hypothetical protein